jgi:glycosyltransferase involved in cell wall biosynthesis
MKILLVSCHKRLEDIERRIFTELGHEVTTIGFSMNQNSEAFNSLFWAKNPDYKLPSIDPESGFCRLPPELIVDFDMVVIHHYPHVLWHNLSSLKYKKFVVIRSIGMPNPYLDSIYYRFSKANPQTKLVRMSALEEKADALITQCCEPKEKWVGDLPKILTVRKMFRKRAHEQCFAEYSEIIKPFLPFMTTLAGSENEDIDYAINPSDKELDELHKSHMVYLYPTNRSSFVTFSLIEAMAHGCPIVAFDERFGGVKPEILEGGKDCLIVSGVEQAQQAIQLLLNSPETRNRLSENILKKSAIFSFDKCKAEWKAFIDEYIETNIFGK